MWESRIQSRVAQCTRHEVSDQNGMPACVLSDGSQGVPPARGATSHIRATMTTPPRPLRCQDRTQKLTVLGSLARLDGASSALETPSTGAGAALGPRARAKQPRDLDAYTFGVAISTERQKSVQSGNCLNPKRSSSQNLRHHAYCTIMGLTHSRNPKRARHSHAQGRASGKTGGQ